MLLFYIIMYLFRWTALYLAGGQISFLLRGESSLRDCLLLFPFFGVIWLIAKLFDFMMGYPQPPKFLNTRTKRIIAAAATLAFGFISGIYL